MKKSELSKGEQTKQTILDTAIKLWPHVTSYSVARELGIHHPNVTYYFGNSDNLRDAVADYAVQSGNSRVIAQLIATKHKAVRKLTALERQKHMDAVS